MNTTDLSVLDSQALTQKLVALVHQERAHLVEFLRHLMEFDQRKIYVARGHSSLFAYCTRELRLSGGSAYRRIVAARLLPSFPIIADFLADGRLYLARVQALREVLTEANHLDLLQRAAACTEREVADLVAELRPEPDVKDSIRKVPNRAPRLPSTPPSTMDVKGDGARTAERATSTLEAALTSSMEVKRDVDTPHANAASLASSIDVPVVAVAEFTSSLEVTPPPRASGRRESRIEVRPTSAGTWAVTMRVGREFLDDFEQVKAALSHKFPDRNFEDVLRECFRITLEHVERRRCGAPPKATKSRRTRTPPQAPGASTTDSASPRNEHPACDAIASGPSTTAPESVTAHPKSSMPETAAPIASASSAQHSLCGTESSMKPSRYIPKSVRREVWIRDGGCCAFVSADGRRCGSTQQVDFHHHIPFANGGPSTPDNLSLRCRVHNFHEAVLAFGADFMEQRLEHARSCDDESTSSLEVIPRSSATESRRTASGRAPFQ